MDAYATKMGIIPLHMAAQHGHSAVAEALLDLTGAPTLSVDFNSSSFDSELLWRSMVEWKRLGLPMQTSSRL